MVKKLMTVEEVAEILSISPSRLRDKGYRKKIGLSVIRIGSAIRIAEDELDSCINRNTESTCAGIDDSTEEG